MAISQPLSYTQTQSASTRTAYPVSFSCWFYFTTLPAATGNIFGNSRGNGNAGSFGAIEPTGAVSILQRTSGGVVQQTTSATTPIATNTWYHMAYVLTNSSNARLYINGTEEVVDTTTFTDMYLTTVARPFLTYVGNYAGAGLHIGECAVYNIALSTDEIQSLTKGFAPFRVRPQNIVSCWRTVRAHTAINSANAFGGAASTTVQPHPRVY